MTKSFKEMNYSELLDEETRVRELLLINKNRFTHKQNTKYLQKIQTALREYEKNRFGRVLTKYGA